MTALVVLLLLAGGGHPLDMMPPLPPDAGNPLFGPGVGFRWEPPPKVVADAVIPGVTYVNGVPVQLRQLVVAAKPEEVGRHFLESFKRQGLYVADRQAIDTLFSGVDPSSLTTYSVVLQANGDKHTTVILGEARPLQPRRSGAQALPVMPGVKGALPVEFEGYTQLNYDVGATAAQVEEFYGAQLGKQGYAREGSAGQPTWARQGERVEVRVSAAGARAQVTVRRTYAPAAAQ
jgi:hypothetical protein